ncbi:glycosyl transferase 2 family protein [Listeria floridensis FSL S10-1187]|uniref:Glycosyl transferase 2 family protein n=1 Tax=Listeria floridensis FSL S10-1187 TaxID=1265817 RepID=A0ABP3AY12_9LIST|nr:glycosyltransferase family 2 protein [Listeria floridensis]EUJ29128.1 glycosyl transferase 2 family protein [Listeria floridensis FSL S10-1187]
MKNLTIIVPCFNSEDYLSRCIDSLLIGEEALEILIVNDGSTDRTAELAEAYKKRFPKTIHVIHQPNRGHGGAINTGLRAATGRYLKVVDSDDWVDQTSLLKLIETLQQLSEGEEPDLLVNNYVYEKQGVRRKKTVQYTTFLPQDQSFNWRDVKFPIGKYLLMHSLIYKTSLLKEHLPPLPEHTFYVDNLFAFWPLPFTEKIYYLNIDLYRYFIGRSDQSVNEEIMIKRIDQQLSVNYEMINYYTIIAKERCSAAKYMRQFLEIITSVSSVLLLKQPTAENLVKKRQLWRYIRENDNRLYQKLRLSLLGQAVHLPGQFGRRTTIGVYKVCKKVYGFN